MTNSERPIEALKSRRKEINHRKMVEEFVKDIEAEANGASVIRNETGLHAEMSVEEILATIEENIPSIELFVDLPPETETEVAPDSDDTVIYESVETYLYKLNNDTKYERVTEDEKNLLDRVFEFMGFDHIQAKNLVNAFLETNNTSKRVPEKEFHQK